MAHSPEAGAACGASGSSLKLAAGQSSSAALFGKRAVHPVTLPSGRTIKLPKFEAVFLRALSAANGAAVDVRELIEALQREGQKANNLDRLVWSLGRIGLNVRRGISYRLTGSVGEWIWHDTVRLPNGREIGTNTMAGVISRELALRTGKPVSLDSLRAALQNDKVSYARSSISVALGMLRNAGVRIATVQTIALAPERVH